MTSQAGHQIIIIHILPNIARSKGNQAMKRGQLIKYNVKNIFLQKSSGKSDRETNWTYNKNKLLIFLLNNVLLYLIQQHGSCNNKF